MNAITRRFSPLSLTDEENSPLLPTFSENPLAVLARTRPDAATGIMHRILDIQKREQETQKDLARMSLLRGISSDHTAQICTFIQANAGKSHVAATVETDGVAEENAFWFARGQRVRMRTTFVGEAW